MASELEQALYISTEEAHENLSYFGCILMTALPLRLHNTFSATSDQTWRGKIKWSDGVKQLVGINITRSMDTIEINPENLQQIISDYHRPLIAAQSQIQSMKLTVMNQLDRQNTGQS